MRAGSAFLNARGAPHFSKRLGPHPQARPLALARRLRAALGPQALLAILLLLVPAQARAEYTRIELKIFGIGSSWGGFESLCIRANPAKGRTATKWSPGGPLIRLHIGLEDTADLIADLEQGFAKLRA